MIPALAQVSTLHAPFEKDVEDYAAGHCRHIELWLGKLETYLRDHTTDDVRALLNKHEISAPVASFQGGLLTSQGDARREHWAHFERRLLLCRTLGVKTLVVAGDIGSPLQQDDLDRVSVSLADAARIAAEHDVRVAFEFQARAPFADNLQTAASVVAEVGHSHLGLCLDAFHFYCGRSKTEDLGYLTRENLFHVQFCDLAGVPREFATDADRIIPGDGDIPFSPIVNHLQAIGYPGLVSIELMNHQIWQVSPRSFGEIAMTALRKTLGQAAME